MCNREYLPALIASIFLGGPALGQTVGFVDDFSSPGTHGWSSKISNTNPETGGVGGVGDGYLKIEQADAPFNFGTHNDGVDYAGNWTAAGNASVVLLSDVSTDEDFSFHFLVTGDGANPNGESTWQYNTGFQPRQWKLAAILRRPHQRHQLDAYPRQRLPCRCAGRRG